MPTLNDHFEKDENSINIDDIRKSVSDDNLELVLKKLEPFLEKSLFSQQKQERITLSSRLNKLNRENRLGILNPSEYRIEYNRIRKATLEFLDELEFYIKENLKNTEKVELEKQEEILNENLSKQIQVPNTLIKDEKVITPDVVTNEEDETIKDHVLIMKGGGIKGLAYVGALKELYKYYNFNWFAGTSAGAIAAVLLASGYTTDELEKELSTDIQRKIRTNFLVRKLNNVREEYKLDKTYLSPILQFFETFLLCIGFLLWFPVMIIKGGIHEAKDFNDWIQTLLSEKLDKATEVKLEDLPKRVSIYATKRYEDAVIFDSHGVRNQTSAAFAVRCSMSIPFYFTPQRKEGLYVFDGGVQHNYPVNILLENNKDVDFIGLYLGDEHFKGHKNTNSILCDLLKITTESNDYKALKKYEDETVVIDVNPISTLDFKLSSNEKSFLLECGRVYALKFLKKNKKLGEDFDYKSEKDKLEVFRKEIKRERLNKRLWRWGKRIPIILIVVFYFFIFQSKSDVINELGLEVHLLTQKETSKCNLNAFFQLEKKNFISKECLPEGTLKSERLKVFIGEHGIQESKEKFDLTKHLQLPFSFYKSFYKDSTIIKICFENPKENEIGFKIELKDQFTPDLSNPSIADDWYPFLKESLITTSFVYKKGFPNNKCVTLKYKK
ncbi:MAG: patatin-like phospholipase family protein [Saprospiraceae bacterium]